MAEKTAVVIFDLDGTLTDSESGIVASYRHALDSLGMAAPEDAIRRRIGPPLVDGFAGLGVPAAQLAGAIKTYREYFSTSGILENRLYPGTEGILRQLVTDKVVVGLATSKLTEYADRILDQLGIRAYFTVVAGSTRDGTRLHKEDVLGYALAELGEMDRSSAVMVGDREHDVRAARQHGLRSIGVTWGYGSRSELIDAGADYLAETPGDLLGLLK